MLHSNDFYEMVVVEDIDRHAISSPSLSRDSITSGMDDEKLLLVSCLLALTRLQAIYRGWRLRRQAKKSLHSLLLDEGDSELLEIFKSSVTRDSFELEFYTVVIQRLWRNILRQRRITKAYQRIHTWLTRTLKYDHEGIAWVRRNQVKRIYFIEFYFEEVKQRIEKMFFKKSSSIDIQYVSHLRSHIVRDHKGHLHQVYRRSNQLQQPRDSNRCPWWKLLLDGPQAFKLQRLPHHQSAIPRIELTALRWKLHHDRDRYWSDSSAVYSLECKDPTTLYRISRDFTSPAVDIPVRYELEIIPESAVVTLQKWFRGIQLRLLIRYVSCLLLISLLTSSRDSIALQLMMHRASVVIQRLWRNSLLKVRFNLLNTIHSVCDAIDGGSIFLDALTYFSLIRFQKVTFIPPLYSRYPEFSCLPLIGSDGRLLLRRAYFGTQSFKDNRRFLKRWGFPHWLKLSWLKSTASPVPRHEKGSADLLKMLSSVVHTSVTRFALKSFEYDVIKLEFPSSSEAKWFAAALIIFTFDYITKSSVLPLNATKVHQKLNEHKLKIIQYSKSIQFTRHRFPIEAKIPLVPPPAYLMRNTDLQNRNEQVRFRFMMSAFRKTIHEVCSPIAENEDELLHEAGLWDPLRIVLWCARTNDERLSSTTELSNAEIAALTRMELKEFKEFSTRINEAIDRVKAKQFERIKQAEKSSVAAVIDARRQKHEECQLFRMELTGILYAYNVHVESEVLRRYEVTMLKRIRRLQSSKYVKQFRQENITKIMEQSHLYRESLEDKVELRTAEELLQLNQKKDLIQEAKFQKATVLAARKFFRTQGDVLLSLSKIK